MTKYIIWIGILIIAMSSCQKEVIQEVITVEAEEQLYPRCFQEIINELTDNPNCSGEARIEWYEYEDESIYKIIIDQDDNTCILDNQDLRNRYINADCTLHRIAMHFCGNDPFVEHFHSNIEFKEIVWSNN